MGDKTQKAGTSRGEKMSIFEDYRGKKRKQLSGGWGFIAGRMIEESDNMANFDFLIKAPKIEPPDTYETEMPSELESVEFMNDDDDNESSSGMLEKGTSSNHYQHGVANQNDYTSDDSDDMEDSTDYSNFPNDHFLNQGVTEEGQIAVHMDIREPLTTLRSLLQEKIGYSLEGYTFFVQETQLLEDHKNLVDQCVQGEGMVQINCELKEEKNMKKINIVDVLKPAEEYVEILGNGDDDIDNEACGTNDDQKIRWVVDLAFKKDQQKLGIPQDPAKWSVENVRHWLMWAVRQFNLSGIKLSDWAVSGAELSNMTRENFKTKVPRDPKNSFWTHFELLRKCKIVAINPQRGDSKGRLDAPNDLQHEIQREEHLKHEKVRRMNSQIIKTNQNPLNLFEEPEEFDPDNDVEISDDEEQSYRSPLGPVQLWQFLLELLTDRHHRNSIQWLEEEGEFKLVNPELVAHLWGIRKNKPTMNYEKLSRALRYYYDGDMIAKVHSKKFVYKFVCDLKEIIGYSASELNALVIESELKAKQKAKGECSQKQMTNAIFINDFVTLLP